MSLLILFGRPATQTLTPTGIATAEALGAPTITVGVLDLAPAGVTSGEAFGSPTITYVLTVEPAGIASDEAFGTATLTQTVTANLLPDGIVSDEAFGSTTITFGAITLTPAGVATAEAVGTPVLTRGGLLLTPVGISSAEAVGTPSGAYGAITVAPGGIATAAAVGLPFVVQLAPRWRFTPPTVQELGKTKLFDRYHYPVGVSVLKTGGAYVSLRHPLDTEIEAADAAYIGGHEYTITEAEAETLTAAGYGAGVSNF